MSELRELSDKFKVSVRSAGEVIETMNSAISRMRTTGDVMYWEPDGSPKSLTKEAFVNATLLYFDTLPYADKVKALTVGIGRLREILSDEDRGTVSASGPQFAQNEPEPPTPRRKRKSG